MTACKIQSKTSGHDASLCTKRVSDFLLPVVSERAHDPEPRLVPTARPGVSIAQRGTEVSDEHTPSPGALRA